MSTNSSELKIWHRANDSFVLSGEDVRRWCNGMFTNNIRSMTIGCGSRSAICDDRGRIIGFIDVTCISDERFFATLDGLSLADFQERFNMYMILDDIELSEVSNGLLHVAGDASEWLLSKEITLPSGENRGLWSIECEVFGGIRVTHRERIGISGWDIIPLANQDLATLLGVTLSTQTHYNALRIEHGRAEWPTDGTDKSIIHELRLNEECCAFDKGCYIGQEIINRIDVKSAYVKQLRRIKVSGEAALGDALMLDGKEMGRLSSLSGTLALSVLRKKGWTPGTVLDVSSGGTAQVLD